MPTTPVLQGAATRLPLILLTLPEDQLEYVSESVVVTSDFAHDSEDESDDAKIPFFQSGDAHFAMIMMAHARMARSKLRTQSKNDF